EGIPAAADIVNLRYKSCPEMEGQDHPPPALNLKYASLSCQQEMLFKYQWTQSGHGQKKGLRFHVTPCFIWWGWRPCAFNYSVLIFNIFV
ncbi:hypothetical protein, partial [Enterobacter asburiae]|uniref:hypothetical protein n=1 Tax=Enterobacter asburiae TaxID=61645 RepID=UPI003BBC7F84